MVWRIAISAQVTLSPNLQVPYDKIGLGNILLQEDFEE